MEDRSSESGGGGVGAGRRPGRPEALDELKRNLVVWILAMGASRRTTARFVGCAVSTIANTALRDPEFDERIRRAENGVPIECLKRLRAASAHPQHWRAAAWTLERVNVEEFGKRSPATISAADARRLLEQLADMLGEEIADEPTRLRVLLRANEIARQLHEASPPAATESTNEHDDDQPAEE